MSVVSRCLRRVGNEAVAQDAVHPGGEVGAGGEAVLRRQRIRHRVLHQILGGGAVAGQRQRLHPSLGRQGDQLLVELGAAASTTLRLGLTACACPSSAAARWSCRPSASPCDPMRTGDRRSGEGLHRGSLRMSHAPRAAASRVRARDTRAFIVPTGTPQIAAASACESPAAPTRITASRSSGGSAAIARARSRTCPGVSCAAAAASSGTRVAQPRRFALPAREAAHGRCCARWPGTRRAGPPPARTAVEAAQAARPAPPARGRPPRCAIRRGIVRRRAVRATIPRARSAVPYPWLVRSPDGQYQPHPIPARSPGLCHR